MCTMVILRRPGHKWPLIIAANRDEMVDRPWLEPARHWPERPETMAGLDKTAGGSWLGVNDYGVIAGVLNRIGTLGDTLGPEENKRTRGELVLEALDHAEAVVAKDALLEINPDAYRPFNLLVADARDAFWLSLKQGAKSVVAHPIPDGVSMLTARDLNDTNSKRIAHYLPLFKSAAPPEPKQGNWAEWQDLMTNSENPTGHAKDAMNIILEKMDGFGTISSSLLALAGPDRDPDEPSLHWLFSKAGPGSGSWRAIT